MEPALWIRGLEVSVPPLTSRERVCRVKSVTNGQWLIPVCEASCKAPKGWVSRSVQVGEHMGCRDGVGEGCNQSLKRT